ncbi:MAG: magnesium transporter, partial [Bdellovibrionales bacterium]|nr:magnesium transporter [Bdellovibrionales bacterium]
MQSAESIEPSDVLAQLLENPTSEALEQFFRQLEPAETARLLARLEEQELQRILQLLPNEAAADLLGAVPDVHAVAAINQLPAGDAAAIICELPSNEQADLLGELEPEFAEAVIESLPPEDAEDARKLGSYDDDVAGGLMVTEYLSYPVESSVGEVLEDLRSHVEAYRDFDIQYVYVTEGKGRLAGVLRLRDIVLARQSQTVKELMIPDPISIEDSEPLLQLKEIFDRHPFLGLPVVHKGKQLVGVIKRVEVEKALAEQLESDFRKSQGIVGGEELRTMPLLLRSRRRLSWLSVNIGLNIIAASIIAGYQNTIAQVIALAVFLPMISDMSGCSGNQAVAVSMRELSLGLIKQGEVAWVWMKEIVLGIINGLVLGILIGGVAWLWQGNPVLGAVVGAALAINTAIAVSIGGTLPLIVKQLRFDPALASGP